jgi:hypothetical protein
LFQDVSRYSPSNKSSFSNWKHILPLDYQVLVGFPT